MLDFDADIKILHLITSHYDKLCGCDALYKAYNNTALFKKEQKVFFVENFCFIKSETSLSLSLNYYDSSNGR